MFEKNKTEYEYVGFYMTEKLEEKYSNFIKSINQTLKFKRKLLLNFIEETFKRVENSNDFFELVIEFDNLKDKTKYLKYFVSKTENNTYYNLKYSKEAVKNIEAIVKEMNIPKNLLMLQVAYLFIINLEENDDIEKCFKRLEEI